MILCVSDAVSVSPEAIEFRSFPKGQAAGKTIEVRCSPGTRLKTVSAKPDMLAVAAGDSNTEIIPVRVAAKQDLPPGPFAGEVQIELTGHERASLAVPFTGEVLPR